MTNISARKIFTESLHDLLSEGLTLYQSLKIMSESKVTDKKIRNASSYISKCIENGNHFSGSLKTCSEITFDETYIAFSMFAEQTGNLCQALDFLIKKTKREIENRENLFNALLYPLFVIVLVICMISFLMFSGYAESIFSSVMSSKKMISILVKNLMWFLFSSISAVFFLVKLVSENKLYEAFLAGSYLVTQGLGLPTAIGFASTIVGLDTKNGKVFSKAKEGLEYGMDLRTAFLREGNRRLQRKIEMALLMAEETGNKNEVMEKIAALLKIESDRKRQLTIKLVEPVFILITGVFLLGISIDLILPVFSNIGI